MNIAFFIRPKSMTVYLYAHCSLPNGLRRLQQSGRSALPVLSADGKYLGAVGEGDFLLRLADEGMDGAAWQQGRVGDLLSAHSLRAVPATAAVEELLPEAAEHTFVPVIDDVGSFIGIARRSDLIRHFARRAGQGEDATDSQDCRFGGERRGNSHYFEDISK